MRSINDILIGKSAELLSLIDTAGIIATTDVSVLILGESGTGKELLAKVLHQESPRAKQSFISINCAALPESLVESELFGHRKGAFTGADKHFPGRIRAAENGTLFLDEIGELPYAAQGALLRFLESGEIQPVGSTHPEHVNVRLIAATNRDLAERVKQGLFRADLYYRLNIVPMALPSLRERQSDIKLLVNHLNAQLAQSYQLNAPTYSSEALAIMQDYHWPGNVRELRNLCERMLILFSGKTILPTNLPAELVAPREQSRDEFILPQGGLSLVQIEMQCIQQALTQANGNQSKAARLLCLSRDAFLYRLKKYGLQTN